MLRRAIVRLILVGFILAGLSLSQATRAVATPPTYLPWQNGVTYSVTQGNNQGPSHNTQYTRYGWDFGMASGTPVLAAAPGRVTIASYGNNNGWGNTVTVCYGDGTCSRYGHLSSIAVSPGQSVGQAQLVGRVGSTGNSSGPHLHYQLENGSGTSLPSRFVEAGVPGAGARVTSRNRDAGFYRASLDAQFPMDGDGVVHIAQGDGPKVSLGFNLTNSGTRTWENVRLALTNDPPHNMRRALGWETLNSIPGNIQRVEPGQTTYVRFHVNPEEINRPGDYPFRFQLFDHGSAEWIPGALPSFVLRVNLACYTSSFVGQSVSPLTAAGESGELEIALKNEGTCNWQADGPEPVRLGTVGPHDGSFRFADDSWINPSRIGLVESSVAPGEIGHFRATFSVPEGTPAGRYDQRFAPVAEGRQWFSEHLGISLPFYVGDADHLPFTAGDYQAQWITQTYTAGPLSPGESTTVTVTYRNTGPAVWFPGGQYPVHYRACRPRDRGSGFLDPQAPSVLPNATGVRLPERVSPGESVTITLPLKVADWVKPGPYPEYFCPVAERLAWFGPDDVWWRFEVR